MIIRVFLPSLIFINSAVYSLNHGVQGDLDVPLKVHISWFRSFVRRALFDTNGRRAFLGINFVFLKDEELYFTRY